MKRIIDAVMDVILDTVQCLNERNEDDDSCYAADAADKCTGCLVLWHLSQARSLVGTERCPKCRESVPEGSVYERHSHGVYAGKFCDACCSGFTDRCGLDRPQGGQADLDEPIEPDWPTDLTDR